MGACYKTPVVPHNHKLKREPADLGVVMIDVIVAGGGPTGMMLAAELALADVDVAIVERRPTQSPRVARRRSALTHPRDPDQRMTADRFLSEGQVAQVQGFAFNTLDISDFPTRHPYGLGLWQNHIERILAEWVGELPVTMTAPDAGDGLRAGRNRRRRATLRR